MAVKRMGVRLSTAANHQIIAEELATLAQLDLGALRQRLMAVTGRAAPWGFRRDYLMKALSYEIKVRALGALSPTLKRRLRQLAVAAREDRFDQVLGVASLKPGTVLMRIWQGQTHHVMVTSDGFVCNGERYGSLSTIARAITGTSWNGWTLFGVEKRKQRNKNAARPPIGEEVDRPPGPTFEHVSASHA